MARSYAPVFIIGSYRSGTSITTWCLGQHPNIWVLPETYWIAQFAQQVAGLYEAGASQPAAHFNRCALTEGDFWELGADFVDSVVRKGQERRMRKVAAQLARGGKISSTMALQRGPREPKSRWVDGTPENAHYVGEILRLFPDAVFIHLVRNPKDVVRSLAKFDQAGGEPQEFEDGFNTWKRLASAAWEAEQEFGSGKVRRFLHAELESDPKKTIGDMLDFAGENFVAQCLEPLNERINSSKVSDGPEHFGNVLTGDLLKLSNECLDLFETLQKA